MFTSMSMKSPSVVRTIGSPCSVHVHSLSAPKPATIKPFLHLNNRTELCLIFHIIFKFDFMSIVYFYLLLISYILILFRLYHIYKYLSII